MAPSSGKRKAVFDPTALDGVFEDDWPIPANKSPNKRNPVRGDTSGATAAPTPTSQHGLDKADARRNPPASKAATQPPPKTQRTRTPGHASRQSRPRPPEVSLSAEVYQHLAQVSASEKLERRANARSFGVIVMDALDHHADRLATAWTVDAADQPTGESLFIRASTKVVPPRRRHVLPPRTIPLAGMSLANARLLDDYVVKWGSTTRSALVEQALRYEFEIPT